METIDVVLIGAGNVATHLGGELQRRGCVVRQVYSRTEASARRLADRLRVPFTTDVDAVVRDASLYVVAVKDAALDELLPRLTRGRDGALFVHTAGSIPLSVWEGLTARYGVFYPMQTFSRQREVDFADIPCFVEANTPQDTALLRRLAERMSRRVYEASSGQRRCLHIAAVFACNFTNHLYAVCHRLLAAQGLPFEVMLPLIDETARKVHELSPEEAQTGPARRYDENVIGRHLQMLSGQPDLAQIYDLLSRHIHDYETHKTE